MNEDWYLQIISQLESEIDYLHDLLDKANIPYKKKAPDIEDLSPEKNILYEEDQGARIKEEPITKKRISFFYNLFKGEERRL